VVEAGEACDDGNTVDGDGCSATCGLEGNWTIVLDGPFSGDDQAFGVAIDPSDDVVVIGRVEVATDLTRAWVAKYDRHGVELWSELENGANESSYGAAVGTDQDGMIYALVGTSDEVRVLRYPPSGGPGQVLYTLAPDWGPGGLAVAADGSHYMGVGGLRKHTRDGEALWDVTLPDYTDCWGDCLALFDDGGVAVAGSTTNSIELRKYSQDGVFEWTYAPELTPDDVGYDDATVAPHPSGDVVLLSVRTFCMPGGCDFPTEVVRLSAAGAVVQEVTLDEYTRPDHATVGGDLTLTLGSTRDLDGNERHEIWIHKFNENGTTLWTESYEGTGGCDGWICGGDSVHGIATASTLHVYAVGVTASADTGEDIWIGKFAP
jgi:cysteine-rich repeat protein